MSAFTIRMGVAGLLALSLPACWEPGAKPPNAKINPSPKDHYEITLTIEDPPRVVQRVDGQAQFNIKGVYRKCMPYADRIAGTKPKSSFVLPVTFERQTDNTYVGYVFRDWIIDEDYYGLGICEWDLTGVVAHIFIDGAKRDVVVFKENIINSTTQKSVCPRDLTLRLGCLNPIDTEDFDPKKGFVVLVKSKDSP